MTKKRYFGALALLLAACGGQATGTDVTSNQLALKKAAAEAAASGTVPTDPCATNGWYGDKVCDSFCKEKDTDCVAQDQSVPGCAQFVETSDGKCSRLADDPCISQDPDCAQTTPSTSVLGNGCATYAETPDGKCSRPANDPCISQDPDCAQTTPSSSVPGGISTGAPRLKHSFCPTIVETSDGKCSIPDTDPCQFIDPDCRKK